MDVETLPVLVDPRAALEADAPQLFDTGNLLLDHHLGDADAVAKALLRGGAGRPPEAR